MPRFVRIGETNQVTKSKRDKRVCNQPTSKMRHEVGKLSNLRSKTEENSLFTNRR